MASQGREKGNTSLQLSIYWNTIFYNKSNQFNPYTWPSLFLSNKPNLLSFFSLCWSEELAKCVQEVQGQDEWRWLQNVSYNLQNSLHNFPTHNKTPSASSSFSFVDFSIFPFFLAFTILPFAIQSADIRSLLANGTEPDVIWNTNRPMWHIRFRHGRHSNQ